MARRKHRVSHAKEAFYIICILIIFLIGLFICIGPNGYLQMKRIQAELETHRARVDALTKSNEERSHTNESLSTDKVAIESYARKKGYGKSDERVEEVPQQDRKNPASDLLPPAKGK